ncbi:MAG: acyl-[ACP]--phospholipid O-acyltransferase [Chlamydiales bacterium]
MKNLFTYFIYGINRFLLSLRYRIRVEGRETLTPEALNKPGGTLFLANHTAEIDPCILFSIFWLKFHLRPVAIDYLFHKPIIRNLLNLLGALSVPSFEDTSNSYKRRQMDKTYEKIFSLLKQKNNLLIYPAGGLKLGAEEVIGGASGVHTILQGEPSVNVVLIRTTGLWGSSFSKALTGKTPDLGKAFFNGFKILLRNFIFFAPRRDVLIECTPAPKDFPWKAERRELNSYLERWFNAKGPEPLTLVSFSLFKKMFPKIQEKLPGEEISLEKVPDEIKRSVIQEIAKLTRTEEEKIQPSHHLSLDLGLDSLDISQIVFFLRENFGASGIHSSDLSTVGSVFVYAARLKKGKGEEEEEPEEKKPRLWDEEKGRPHVAYAVGKTLPEAFFRTCERMDGYLACVDRISGVVSYRTLKRSVLILARAIARMPGENIGIMMPASIAVNVVVLATMLAGKVPVMVNWTLGSRNLRSVVEQSKIQVTISSWNFLNRLDNVDLDGLDDQFVLLEEVSRKLSLIDKFRTLWEARKKTKSILKKFKKNEEDTAVILFTSGTETFPKAVRLTHKNLLSNQQGAFELVHMCDTDVLLGALPPFHSFGFSVTGLFPWMAGLKVAYTPNPTDGRRMASLIENWNVTIICLAPTFLKNLLRVSSSSQLKTIRLIVAGAEKTPPELYDQMNHLNPSARIIEGYGITECSPILTLNPPDQPSQGVGIPFPQVELKIVDPDTFEPLSRGKEGLILARGPNIFKGYIDPHLPSPFVQVEGKSWYQTGDLGFLTEDGYLILSGRLKRFVKIGGEMVSLMAIEEALEGAAAKKGMPLDPELPSLAVCGIEEEGKKSSLYLFTTFPITTEEANEILKESGMSNLIRIRSAKKLPVIPLLGTGKIDYRKLQDTISEK